MALKPDLSGVKSFFFEKGEKLGMFACVAAAVALVGYGLMGGVGANTDNYAGTIEREAKRIKAAVATGDPAAVPEKPNLQYAASWDDRPSTFPQGGLFQTQDSANYDKRRNPRALGILADPDPKKKQIQMHYVNGAYLSYVINHSPTSKVATVIKEAKAAGPVPKGAGFGAIRGPGGAQGAAGAGQQPIIDLQPVRMVVVDAVFPLSEQLEEFRKKLRKSHVAELFDTGDLPRFLGLIVGKVEMTPGKEPVASMLIDFDPKSNKVELDPALQRTLREALPDEQLQNVPFVFQGLVMMQPKLSSPLPEGISYPKADLEGIDWENLVVGGPGGVGANPPIGAGRPLVRPQGGVGAGPVMRALPGGPQGAAGAIGVEVEFDTKFPWPRLAPEFLDKFSDKFYPLDPSGIFPDPEEGKPQAVVGANPPPAQFRGGFGGPNVGGSIYQGQSPHSATSQWGVYPKPEMPAHLLAAANANPAVGFGPPKGITRGPLGGGGNQPIATKPYEALVRFIDVGVKPGSTYKYFVRVRVANPNFGKKTEVAFPALADIAELTPAPPVETPTITIPHEYFLYAYDAKKLDNPAIVNGSDDKEARSDQVAVQIHRWAERSADEHVIGDWVIAERILLRRGDPIARATNIEIPIWNKKFSTYDLTLAMVAGPAGKQPGDVKGPAKDILKPLGKKPPVGAAELGTVGGVPVNFAETSPPAVLADFDGGRKRIGQVNDESASNLLILNADGKLIVRSSRADSEPNTPEYIAREQRLADWKAKVEPFRNQANPGANPNPAFNQFLPQGGNRKQ